MGKKGQGLPVSTIVIVIIAVVTLTLVILFATGTLGDLFARTQELSETTADEVTVMQTECNKLCIRAKTATSLEMYRSSGYCQTIFEIVQNEEISESHCWENPIFYDCSVSVKGATYSGTDCIAAEEA